MSYGIGTVITHFNNIPLITEADIHRILFTDYFFTNCVIKQCIWEESISKFVLMFDILWQTDPNKFPPPPHSCHPANFYAANEYHFSILFAVSTGELQMFSEFHLVAFIRKIILTHDK